jgi:ABC-type Zn uptake system ZnuABC Zn-binding protein ZnuA
MKKISLLLVSFVLATFLFACTDTTVKYDVYVTVYPLKYIVDSLAQGTEITCGVVPGVTSHQESVDWAPKQIIAMTEAEYLFYVGANFDVYIDNQIDSIFRDQPVTLVKLETAIVDLLIEGIVDTHDSEDTPSLGLDPHFWTSPKRLLMVVDLIYAKLIDETLGYPEATDQLLANRQILLDDLNRLDQAFDQVINPESNLIMTSTNLYGYLKADYGLKNCSISPGYHEETDTFTTAQKDAIVAEATEFNIRYIVYEKNASSPLSNEIFASLVSLGVNPIKLEYDILHSLLAAEEELGHDYYDIMMYENLELLKTATGYIAQE